MSAPKKNEILLESGTNEMELMEFTIDGNTFGVNVAKIREIIMPSPVKKMPHSNPVVEGVFKLRDIVITVIDLPQYLGVKPSDENGKDLFIVTNFNKVHVAFRVHTVVGIDRIRWSDIQKPDKTIYGGSDGVATGIAECQGRLITILDFEKIIAEISPETTIQVSEIERMGNRRASDKPIVIAEDSVLLSKLIVECLHKAGYANVEKCDNGQEAWDYLQMQRNAGDVLDKVACVITDIEMPKMDGHRLTKLIKDDKVLKNIPVVIFSSLINPEMYKKGKEVGADEQLTKPEIAHLVDVIDSLLYK
ncbi:MAG: chemotaxis protein [Oscillospiraceae bacterium]